MVDEKLKFDRSFVLRNDTNKPTTFVSSRLCVLTKYFRKQLFKLSAVSAMLSSGDDASAIGYGIHTNFHF